MTEKALLPTPDGCRDLTLVRSYPVKQLWRAAYYEQEVALRLLRFPVDDPPVVEPTWGMRSLGEGANRLGLTHVAEFVACGGPGPGYYAMERWMGTEDISALGQLPWDEAARLLQPIAKDLVTLHARGKWHGGIRPERVRIAGSRAILVGLTWSAAATTLVRKHHAMVERPEAHEPFIPPEYLLEGPGASLWALDVYSFAHTLLSIAGVVPPVVLALLERATLADPRQRPSMREMVEALGK